MKYFVASILCFFFLQCKNSSNENSDKITHTVEITNTKESDNITLRASDTDKLNEQNSAETKITDLGKNNNDIEKNTEVLIIPKQANSINSELPVEKKTAILPEDFILGKWINEDAIRKIEILKSGNDYIGKVIYDSEAKVPIGTLVLKLKYKSGKWEGITIVPKDKEEIKTIVTKIDENTLQFSLSKGIMSRKRKWKKL